MCGQSPEEGLGRGGVAALLADTTPEFTEDFRNALADHLDRLEQAIAADVESGQLRANLDVDTAVNLIFGSYLGEVLRHGRPRPDWTDRTLAMLTGMVRPPEQA